MRTAKTLIRLGGCPGWSWVFAGRTATLLVLSWGSSNIWIAQSIQTEQTWPLRFKYTTKFSLPKIACPAIVYAEIVVVIDPFFVGVCPWIKVYRYNPTEICQQRLQGVQNVAQKLCSWERSFSWTADGNHNLPMLGNFQTVRFWACPDHFSYWITCGAAILASTYAKHKTESLRIAMLFTPLLLSVWESIIQARGQNLPPLLATLLPPQRHLAHAVTTLDTHVVAWWI